jgi:hypothetical protein
MIIDISGTRYWIEGWPGDLSTDITGSVVHDSSDRVILRPGDRIHVKGRIGPVMGDHACPDPNGFFVIDEYTTPS